MISFVILSYGNSGTTLINSILNQHKEIKCYGEIFNHRYKYNGFEYTNETISSKCLERHIDEFLTYHHEKNVIGCNLHFPHIDFFNNTDAVDLISRKFSKIIILRRNPIMVFLCGNENVEFNIKSFEWFLTSYNDNFERCGKISKKLLITSEDLFNKVEENIHTITDYLGVEYFNFIKHTKRIHSDKIENRIKNFEEVKNYLLLKGII